ncbi:MAG: methyl-accepting chemotaxis protein [Symploca sp. SIO1C2]|nr:methyl-accepting chemotaxis protein [Symploca sp. SIO1C2]
MFKKMALQRRMLFAFFFLGLIVLIVSLVGWLGNNRLSKQINTLKSNTLPSVVGLWKVNEGQTQIESSERALLDPTNSLQERRNELDRIEKAWEQIEEGFEEYEKTPRTEEEDKVYRQLQEKWQEWQQNHQEFLMLNEDFEKLEILNPLEKQLTLLANEQGDSPAMAAAREATEALNRLRDRVQANRASFLAATNLVLDTIEINREVGTEAVQEAEEDVTKSTVWMIISIIIGPFTAILFGWYFTRMVAKPLGVKIEKVVTVAENISEGDLTSQIEVLDKQDEIGKLMVAFQKMTQNLNSLISQVQQSGIQITTSTTQIAASGRQLESTVAQQVASTNEVTVTGKEIANTSQELRLTIEEVANVSEETAIAAGKGQKELMRMESTMIQLKDSTSSISGKLGVISEKANNINQVVTTITKVADQTNLLSLNAAIEAEKAGEYGTGFAVVAREIRRLADQTAVATLDIEQMVKDMQSAVATGVMEMDKFTKEVSNSVEDVRIISEQLAQIIQQVQSLTPRFETVNQGMGIQCQGAQEISNAMEQLSEASQQTAESLNEANIALEQLNNAAQSLQQEISYFKV